MAESIKTELEQLESVGRVSAHGRHQVHAGFGFTDMTRDSEHVESPRETSMAENLDDAFSRLKSRVAPE